MSVNNREAYELLHVFLTYCENEHQATFIKELPGFQAMRLDYKAKERIIDEFLCGAPVHDINKRDDYVANSTREPLKKRIEQLERELAEAQTEVERLALEIENQQYTITCASEENQQLKESLADARAEIERLKLPVADDSLLREKLAELAHNQWAGWMEYLFFKSKQVDGCVIIPAWANERWRKQVATRYADLSEEEKDSDRNEADKFLAVFNAQLAERDKLIEQMREALGGALGVLPKGYKEYEKCEAALEAAERGRKE